MILDPEHRGLAVNRALARVQLATLEVWVIRPILVTCLTCPSRRRHFLGAWAEDETLPQQGMKSHRSSFPAADSRIYFASQRRILDDIALDRQVIERLQDWWRDFRNPRAFIVRKISSCAHENMQGKRECLAVLRSDLQVCPSMMTSLAFLCQ